MPTMEQLYAIKQLYNISPVQPSKSGMLCLKPFTNLEINTDGDCSFCCYIVEPIGNIKKSSLNDIFNSDAARYIRERFYVDDYFCCDKSRCPYFSVTNDIRYLNLSLDDLCYRSDIYHCIDDMKSVIDMGPAMLVDSYQGLCNVQCNFCWPFKRYSRHNFDNLVYKNILGQGCLNVKHLQLAGGEPFYNPLIDAVIAKANENNVVLSIYSNLVHVAESTTRLLYKSRIYNLHGSINASSKKTYESLVTGGNWEHVCRNLSFFKVMRLDKRIANFSLSMVVNKVNYHEMLDFIEFGLGDCAADHVAFYPMDDVHVPAELRLAAEDIRSILKILDSSVFSRLADRIQVYALKNKLLSSCY